MMVDETIDDSTSAVMFKPICAHCGYVFKKIEYNANEPYYGWKLSESGFTPPYCPGCGKKIVSLTIPMPDEYGNLKYEYEEKLMIQSQSLRARADICEKLQILALF